MKVKFFSKNEVSWTAFFGGPLAGGFILYQNFKRLGEKNSARIMAVVSVIFTIVIVPLSMLIPDSTNKRIAYFIPVIYTTVAYFIFEIFQNKKINQRLEKGAEKESGWNAAFVGICCLLITLLYIGIYAFRSQLNLKTIQFTIGVLYESRENGRDALKWFHKSADRGYAPAFTSIGRQYAWGRGVAQDHKEAFKWYVKASDLGDLEAQYNIGVIYYEGLGVARDENEAVKWYEKAAESGYAPAQYNLGVIFIKRGEKNAKDTLTGLKWTKKAAEQGHAAAQYNLAMCYAAGGPGIEKNENEAIHWLKKAAAQGDADAKQLLAQ